MDLSLPSLVCLPRIHTTQETANQRSCDTSCWRVLSPTGSHRIPQATPRFFAPVGERKNPLHKQTDIVVKKNIIILYYTNNIFIIFHKHRL